MAGGAIGLFVVKPLIEIPPALGSLAFIALIGIGVVIGQFVGLRLFGTNSDGPPSA